MLYNAKLLKMYYICKNKPGLTISVEWHQMDDITETIFLHDSVFMGIIHILMTVKQQKGPDHPGQVLFKIYGHNLNL